MLWRVVHKQVHVVVSTVQLHQFCLEVHADLGEDGTKSLEGQPAAAAAAGQIPANRNPREKSVLAPLPSRLSHFLTTQAEAYMNGAFEGSSATEDLARILSRELTGGDRES